MKKTDFVLLGYGKPLQERTITVAALTGSQVLVKTLASGLCHSDLHLMTGDFPLKPPLVFGHEIAGEVEAVGPDAKLKIGDKVIVWPWLSLEAGYIGSIGIHLDGGFSTHVLVPEDRFCVPFGDIPVQQAAPLACSGLTAFSALKAIQPNVSQPGKRYFVIIGAGGLGLQAVRLSKVVTGVPPIVCDIDDKKLQSALKLGPEGTIAINTTDEDKALQQIVKHTGGPGTAPDALIDFVGSAQSIQFGMNLLSRKIHKGIKGKYALVGLYGGSFEKYHTPLIIRCRICIEGIYTGHLEDLKELIKVVKKVDHDLPLREEGLDVKSINQAVGDLKNGSIIGRVIFRSKL
jgi:D-arabinose 1-dehydrogenase-like Zn-dependent alcohol dehydrogenase